MATNPAAVRRAQRLAIKANNDAKMQSRIEKRLAAAEARAKAEADGDPSFQEVFTKYQSYMTYLQNLPDDERASILGDLTAEANALVDTPFDAETERLRKDLDLKMRTANQQYGALDADSQLKLSQAIAGADRDTIEALTDNFESAAQRGLLNGGILTQMADKVLRTKDAFVNDIRATANLDKTQRDAAQSLGREAITNYGDEQATDISDRRRIARSVQESELYDEQGTLRFLQQQGLGSQLLPTELSTQLERLNNSGVTSPAPTAPVTAPPSRLPASFQPVKTAATPAAPKDDIVPTSDKSGVLSLTQRRILAGPRPSIRGTRAAASQQY